MSEFQRESEGKVKESAQSSQERLIAATKTTRHERVLHSRQLAETSTLHSQQLTEASNQIKDQQGELDDLAGAQIFLSISHKKLKKDFDKA